MSAASAQKHSPAALADMFGIVITAGELASIGRLRYFASSGSQVEPCRRATELTIHLHSKPPHTSPERLQPALYLCMSTEYWTSPGPEIPQRKCADANCSPHHRSRESSAVHASFLGHGGSCLEWHNTTCFPKGPPHSQHPSLDPTETNTRQEDVPARVRSFLIMLLRLCEAPTDCGFSEFLADTWKAQPLSCKH